MSSITTKNIIATTLHTLGLLFCIVPIGMAMWFRRDNINFNALYLFVFLNNIICCGVFLFVLVRPSFVAKNRIIWFGFAFALVRDVRMLFCGFGTPIHPVYTVTFLIQHGFNLVVMLGSLLAPNYFLPQGRPKEGLSTAALA